MPTPEITRALADLAEQFRRQFTVNSRHEARAIAAEFQRAIYKGRPGRPRRDEITEAIKLIDGGMKRFQVYKHLGKETREERRALDAGIRMRRRRQEWRRRAAQNEQNPQ